MLTGHCLCGQVTYQADADPAIVANCHCTDCRRQTSAAYSTVVGVPAPSFSLLSGALKSVMTTNSDTDGPTERRFCPECGTPIISISSAMPDLVFIKAGSLDEYDGVTPAIEAWKDSAVSWGTPEGAPAFARSPG